ncbi:unnamed protein product [Pylaiella littoralis]
MEGGANVGGVNYDVGEGASQVGSDVQQYDSPVVGGGCCCHVFAMNYERTRFATPNIRWYNKILLYHRGGKNCRGGQLPLEKYRKITAVVEYHGNNYCGCPLPRKNYRELPRSLSTAEAVTEAVDYRKIKTVNFRDCRKPR